MNLTTLQKGVIGSTLALSLIGTTFPAQPAYALTQSELNAQIQSLLAQIALLQSKIGQSTTTCSAFTQDLMLGATGSSVTALQNFLIKQGQSIPAGATGYFGGQTQQALSKFQSAHGISPAVGYFGPLTRGKANSLCAPGVETPTPETPKPTPTPEVEAPLSGEAFIDRFSVSDGEKTDLEEGETNAEVMEISFRVTDGDIKLNRFDLGFAPDVSNAEQDPWDTFSTISIWSGTKKIAEIDGSKEKNWREDSPNAGDYLLRISGLNTVIRENKVTDLVVKVSTQKSIKGSENGEIWNIFVPTSGIRAFDADNATVFAGDTSDSVTINIDEGGAFDELLIRRSNTDPDATVLEVSDSSRSGFMQVFAFDIDTDDSRNDIEIRKIPIELTVSSSTLDTFMRDVRITVDGKSYTKKTVTDGMAGLIDFEFKRGEFLIPAGDRITVEVEVDFKALDERNEGVTISGSVDSSVITAKGLDNLAGAQLRSSASGETHVLQTKGTSVTSTVKTDAKVTTQNGDANDYATFSITVDLTAFGQDAYIPTSVAGMSYELTDGIGNVLGTSGTAVVTSNATEKGDYFFIPEGQTKSLTLDVTYVPGIANTTARLQLKSVNFSGEEVAPTQSWSAQPASKYRTSTVTIVN